MAVRGITFDNQLLKSEDFAHQTNYFYQGKMGVTKGCEISIDANGNLVVADGYFIIFGRQVANVGDTVVKVPTVASGTLYSKLVFTIDLTLENTETEFNQGYFEIISNSVAYPNLIQEDLDNGGTKYQLEFYKFANTVPGITNGVDTRTLLGLSVYALSEDLGNVDNLKTVAKTAVGGINELNDDLAKKAPLYDPAFKGKALSDFTPHPLDRSTKIANTGFVHYFFASRMLQCEAMFSGGKIPLANATWETVKINRLVPGSNPVFTIVDGRIKMPSNGFLIMNARVTFKTNSAGDRGIVIGQNDSPLYHTTTMRRACSTRDTELNEAFNFPVDEGDLIGLAVFQSSGGKLDLLTAKPYHYAYVCMTLIGT